VRGGVFELETMLAVGCVALVGLALFYLRADEAQDGSLRLAETTPIVEIVEGGDPAAEVRALAGEVALTDPSVSELAAADPMAEIEALAEQRAEPAAIR
jgi:hypothetical protein